VGPALAGHAVRLHTALSFTLEHLEPYRTRLTVEFYIRMGYAREFLFRIRERETLEALLRRSLTNLDSVVKEIRVPVEY
jgi:hypothetical protein